MKYRSYKLIPLGLTILISSLACSIAIAGAGISLQIGVSPPPLNAEAVPAHHRGMIWIPGFWGWNGQAYLWIPGHRERERRGYRYIQPVWNMVGNFWIFQPGYWVAANVAPSYVQLPPIPPTTLPSVPRGYVISPQSPGVGIPALLQPMPDGNAPTPQQPMNGKSSTPQATGATSQ
jgi:hypothetical protein